MDTYNFSLENIEELVFSGQEAIYDSNLMFDHIDTVPINLDEIKSQYSVTQALEKNVSRLQTASHGIDQIHDVLKDLANFLEMDVSYDPKCNIPVSVLEQFIADHMAEVDRVCQRTTFEGKNLLNGDSGVIGQTIGKGMHFVRGSALIKSSGEYGYEVQVTRIPTASILMGATRLTRETLSKENHIIIRDNHREICYEFKPGEGIQDFLNNFQNRLNESGFELSVFRSNNNYLVLKHNELGDHTRFEGLSQNTSILSRIPGEMEVSIPGKSVDGFINREPAKGIGGYLIGKPGNPSTDGLVIFVNGHPNLRGEPEPKVFVQQNGIEVPISKDGERDLISLPDIRTEKLAVGVANKCGFMNLSMIRSSNYLENIESLKLINYALEDLKDLQGELKIKENHYIELAISLLKSPSATPNITDGDVTALSFEKANSMVDDIKAMIL